LEKGRIIVQSILIGYFLSMAAFMLTLDFPFHLNLILPVLIPTAISLFMLSDIAEDGFLRVVRSVRRTE